MILAIIHFLLILILSSVLADLTLNNQTFGYYNPKKKLKQDEKEIQKKEIYQISDYLLDNMEFVEILKQKGSYLIHSCRMGEVNLVRKYFDRFFKEKDNPSLKSMNNLML
jgi:hypothetical protein